MANSRVRLLRIIPANLGRLLEDLHLLHAVHLSEALSQLEPAHARANNGNFPHVRVGRIAASVIVEGEAHSYCASDDGCARGSANFFLVPPSLFLVALLS